MGRRWFVFGGAGVVIILVIAVMVSSLGENLTYYYFPNEAIENRDDLADGQHFRLAGTIVEHSLVEQNDVVEFDVTDGSASIHVVLNDTPPPLFAEGVPVLIEGSWQEEDFVGTNALIRHDENYEIPDEGGAVAGS